MPTSNLQNLRWIERKLHVVHDWDSVASLPEPMIAGLAAAVFSATGAPLTEPSVEESRAFLAAYEDARAHRWTKMSSRCAGRPGCGFVPSMHALTRPEGALNWCLSGCIGRQKND